MTHKQDHVHHSLWMPTFTLIELLACQGEARRAKRSIRFTLIELLVVVVIIGILASLLLPALSRARYRAQVVVCMGQLKQVGAAWHNYASDYEDFWPDFGEPVRDSTSYNDGARGKSMILANQQPVNGEEGGDLRPILRNYLGATLNEMMRCPLASPKWHNPDAGWRGNNPGNNKYYDIDNYNLGEIAIVQTTYQLYPTGHGGSKFSLTSKQMRRVGEGFVPTRKGTAIGKEFHVLASDVMLQGSRTSLSVMSTHRPFGAGAAEGGNYQNSTTAWVLPAGVFSTANYGLDDGSVMTYPKVGYSSSLDGTFLTTGDIYNIGFYLPAELAQ